MSGILVIGSINMDIVMQVQEMPRLGETIFGSHVEYLPGGKGSNQAAAAARLGSNVTMVGAVGNDKNAEPLLKALADSGVDISAIRAVDNSTGMAAIMVNSKGDNQIIVISGANMDVLPAFVEKARSLIEACSVLLLQCEIPFETVEFAAKLARKCGKIVIFNPAPAPKSLPSSLLRSIDVLTPNETELERLSGLPVTDIASAEGAAKKLIGLGIKSIVVTMGKLGALIVTGEGTHAVSAFDLAPVVDTTAAGDCFNAALAVILEQGGSLVEAVEYANTAASIAVTRKGALPSLPWKDEVEKAAEQLKSMR